MAGGNAEASQAAAGSNEDGDGGLGGRGGGLGGGLVLDDPATKGKLARGLVRHLLGDLGDVAGSLEDMLDRDFEGTSVQGTTIPGGFHENDADADVGVSKPQLAILSDDAAMGTNGAPTPLARVSPVKQRPVSEGLGLATSGSESTPSSVRLERPKTSRRVPRPDPDTFADYVHSAD